MASRSGQVRPCRAERRSSGGHERRNLPCAGRRVRQPGRRSAELDVDVELVAVDDVELGDRQRVDEVVARPARSAGAAAAGGASTTSAGDARPAGCSLASVLARRTAPSTSLTASRSSAGVGRAAGRRPRARRGCCRRATSSTPPRWRTAASGRAAAAARRGRWRSAARADAAGAVAAAAVGPALDQLDVVVAEPPEERLGALQRPGVVEARRTPPSPRRRRRRGGPASPRSTGSVDVAVARRRRRRRCRARTW